MRDAPRNMILALHCRNKNESLWMERSRATATVTKIVRQTYFMSEIRTTVDRQRCANDTQNPDTQNSSRKVLLLRFAVRGTVVGAKRRALVHGLGCFAS